MSGEREGLTLRHVEVCVIENEYQECRDQCAGCYFSKVPCQNDTWSGCLHLGLLNITNHWALRCMQHSPIRGQADLVSGVKVDTARIWRCEVWWQYWLWTQHFLCQWHPLASHWSGVSIPGLWLADLCKPLMAAKNAYMGPALSRCHLQPNRNSSSEPGYTAHHMQCTVSVPLAKLESLEHTDPLSRVTCRHINLSLRGWWHCSDINTRSLPWPSMCSPAHPRLTPVAGRSYLISDMFCCLTKFQISRSQLHLCGNTVY